MYKEEKCMNAIDKLINKIRKMNNPTVIGLDPRYEMLPKYITDKYPNTLEGISEANIEVSDTNIISLFNSSLFLHMI